jgi:hypothetical protein
MTVYKNKQKSKLDYSTRCACNIGLTTRETVTDFTNILKFIRSRHLPGHCLWNYDLLTILQPDY